MTNTHSVDGGGTGGEKRVATSVNELLNDLRHDLYHGSPPIEYAVSNEVWGTFALRPGQIIGLAAPPAIGKTSFVTQATVDALRLNAGATCLTVNVEMTPQVILERQIARLSGVPVGDILGRRMMLGRQNVINPALATLEDIGKRMFFMSRPYTIERIVEAVAEVQPRILVLDYLQRIECCTGVSDARMRLNSLMHEARALADARICVVLVSAVSRTTSKKGGGYNAKELGMGSFRESSEIEYGCDDCFVMYREDEQRADSRDGQKIVHLKHVKSRNNMQQDLRFGFDGAIQRFELLPERDADEDAVEIGPIVPISPGRVSRGNSSCASLIDPFSFDMG